MVAEEGSFIRAGRRLNTHYFLVSRKIRYLEESVGIRLFTRGGSGVTPTPDAAHFATFARLSPTSKLFSTSGIMVVTTSGSLSVGVHVSMLDGELTKAFTNSSPSIRIFPRNIWTRPVLN
ncbi:helix-turn-helix domain-containing protein [Agrobacterium sp. 22-221-1]